MTDSSNLDWMKFYTELADNLLEYQNNRKELIEKIKSIFDAIHMNLPTLEIDNNIIDIDPFTIFGLFNKNITDEKKIAIAHSFAGHFSIHASVPNYFLGIPLLNPMKSTFYAFSDKRKENDIDNLWKVFASAIEYTKTHSESSKADFIQHYNTVSEQLCIKWNLTMGLYWIRPYDFISLDTPNRNFISNHKLLSSEELHKIGAFKKVPDAENYLFLIDKLHEAIQNNENYKTFPELSYNAWVEGEKSSTSQSWLLTWNPDYWKWEDFSKLALQTQNGKSVTERWSCVSSKVNLKDRVYLTLVGCGDDNGIVASGYVTQAPFKAEHWQKPEKTAQYINVEFDKIMDFNTQNYLKINDLNEMFPLQKWNPQSSGIEIKSEYLEMLEEQWQNLQIAKDSDDWFPKTEEYHPGITKDKWLELLNNPSIFTKDALQMMAEFYAFGQIATCKQLALKYQKSFNTYNSGSSYLAKRIAKETNCPLMPNEISQNSKWWPVLYVGKRVNDKDIEGTYQWKIRDEFYEALTEFNILQYLNIDKQDIQKLEKLLECQKYTKSDFLSEVYMEETHYDALCALLKHKKNVILEGAPGVGKTFAAKRLAYAMMGMKDNNRIMTIQFHQSYSYEDFIEGYRPKETGFKLRKGPFYKFCSKAKSDIENDYFFIIDEINRGNLSKIFGELFMLVEKDKRGEELPLLYSQKPFDIPENVYIIGMMNTADRSLAMLDYALRRRFAFFEMRPGFETQGFQTYCETLNSDTFNHLITCITQLNQTIAQDDALGEGFCIGHSFFCHLNPNDNIDKQLSCIVEYEIIPLLKEYWFDEPSKVKSWSKTLRSALQ